MNNKPKQLKKIRNRFYDQTYARQPQLMERLIPFFIKSEIIEAYTEPPKIINRKLERTLTQKTRKPQKEIKIDRKKELRKELNKFQHGKKPRMTMRIKKVSEVRPDILWNLR